MYKKLWAAAAVLSGTSIVLGALPASATQGATGYDISWPQCSGTTSSAASVPGAFAILGVNGGRPYTSNSCLASQLHYAPTANQSVSYYLNTANPGTSDSTWRSETTPRQCPSKRSQAQMDCFSYDYGYNAALDGFQGAVRAVSAAGTTAAPSAAQWWLDIERANSWTNNTEANIANINGALQALKDKGVTYVGIYTNSSSWSSITGSDTQTFSQLPLWAPGLISNPSLAGTYCHKPGVTGGLIRYLQWTQTFSSGTYDQDYDCG